MATRWRINVFFFKSLTEYKLIVHYRIGLYRQILLNVLTITVQYSLKSQNSVFKSHAKQILGNIEGVAENIIFVF